MIVGVYLVLAATFALIQPLRALPDEPAHLEYVEFLAAARRLPRWDPVAPEGGYETQHPPLAYLVYAPVALAALGLGDDARLWLLRLAAIGVGLLWVLLAVRVSHRVLGDSPDARWSAAGLAWLPVFLLYACHVNPDLIVGLLATAVLWQSWELLCHGPDRRRAVWLGLVLGGCLLTKLSGIAAWPVALVAFALRRRRAPDRALARDAAIAFGLALLLAGPWFVRNQVRYGQPVLKAPVHYGSALDNVAAGRATVGQLLAMTAGRTWLSSWCQPDWLPGWQTPGGPERPMGPIVLLYTLLTCLALASLAGLRGLEPDERDFLGLGLVLLIAVVAGQQLAFWTQDIEFNMGGRYVLAAMLPTQVAIVRGLSRQDARLPAVWVGLLLVMNLVAAATIVLILNPHYQPGWRLPFVP